MSVRPADDETLKRALRSPGYQPARADAPALFDRLDVDDRKAAERLERALARLGAWAADEAIARLPAATPPARGRLAGLIGRVAAESPEHFSRLVAYLRSLLEDEDERTRRAAARHLGKLDGDGVAAALAAALGRATSVTEQKALVEALGRVGDASALDLLEGLESSDDELSRVAAEAKIRLRRTLGRAAPGGLGAILGAQSPEAPLSVTLHCREGLAGFVADELGRAFGVRAVAADRVTALLRGRLDSLFAARTALSFDFPLPTHGAADGAEALHRALTSPEARAILARFTEGPLRYRIEWAGAGRRRGLTYRSVEQLSLAFPELVNDPSASLWELIVEELEDGPRVSLRPRGLEDPRFAYRVAHVPASSHPTIAAALARASGVREDDVVWDPFVGAGTELIERARLGPFLSLVGTDLDPGALSLAKQNLASAKVERYALHAADARGFVPRARPTLILTNPPMGRRVLDRTKTGPLYDAFLAHCAELLPAGGRLVWLSPRPGDTAQRGAALGLKVERVTNVDMGGFTAELQRMTKR